MKALYYACVAMKCILSKLRVFMALIQGNTREYKGIATWQIVFLVSTILLGVVFYIMVFIFPRPFWIYETDVEVDFIFRSLALRNGVFVPHGFGVLVDVIGSILMRFFNGSAGFVFASYLVGFIWMAFGLFLFSKNFLKNLSAPLALSVILFFFLNPTARVFMFYWSADMFVFTFAICALTLFWESLHCDSKRMYFYTGLVCALAVAVKTYLFALVIVLPLGYFFRSFTLKNNINDVLRFGIGAVLGILVGFAVFMNSLKEIVFQVFGGVRHVSPLKTILNNVSMLAEKTPVWSSAIIVLSVIFLVFFLRIRKKADINKPYKIFFGVLLTALFLSGAAAFIKPYSSFDDSEAGVALRFFLPVAIYATFCLSILIATLNNRINLLLQYLFAIVIFISFGFKVYDDVSYRRSLVTEKRNIQQIIQNEVNDFSMRRKYKPRAYYGTTMSAANFADWAYEHFFHTTYRFAVARLGLFPNKSGEDLDLLNDINNFDLIVVNQSNADEFMKFKKDILLLDKYRMFQKEHLFFFEKL